VLGELRALAEAFKAKHDELEQQNQLKGTTTGLPTRVDCGQADRRLDTPTAVEPT
jgi:hypothetical protein